MKKPSIMSGLIALAIAGLAGQAMALDNTSATITVTPSVTIAIAIAGGLNATALGPVAVAASTNSPTAIAVQNTGTVAVKLQAKLSNPVGWTASSSAGPDTYVLKAKATADSVTANPADASQVLTTGDADLTGAGNLAPGASNAGTIVHAWFQLGMPTMVSSQAEKTITITFTGLPL